MDLAGTALKFVGRRKAAKEAKRSAYALAAQMRKRAGASRAEGQYASEEERRQAKLVQSRALAVSAASGAGVSNPTVTNILGDIDAEGDYRALIRRYSSETEAAGLEEQAIETIRQGRAAAKIQNIMAAATLFTDVPDLWKKYT